jgi:hypothetical protein
MLFETSAEEGVRSFALDMTDFPRTAGRHGKHGRQRREKKDERGVLF